MTYRSSEAQLANLKRREPKGEVARSSFVSAKITANSKAILQNHLKSQKMSFADLLEAIAEKLETNQTSLAELLGDE
jgi:DNA-directed RNA polymerase delta subunit